MSATVTGRGRGRLAGSVPATLRELMRGLAQPVVVITGRDLDGRPWGMTVSTFTTVSLDPPLVAFCPSRGSRTWKLIATRNRFAVNVLAAHQAEIAALFASSAAGFPQRLSQVSHGLPVLTPATATVICSIRAVHAAGDHDLVLARADHAVVHPPTQPGAQPPARPLAFWRGQYASAHHLQESPYPP